MRTVMFAILAVGVCWAPGFPRTRLGAQETFALTSPVESADFPNLNTEMIIEGDVGQAFELTGNVTVTSAGITGEPPEGPQGWSLGLRNEGLEILGTTTDGTVSAHISKGGLENGGFVVNEIIDPLKKGNDGKTGMVQAVVLALVKAVSLPPNTSQITGKNRYKATIGAAEAVAKLTFVDGLSGSGQPVQNNITFKGETKFPTLGEKRITIRKKVQIGPEQGNCNDGVDNDNDGATDCADSDCDADPVFCPKPEAGKCNDGVDNDKDGKTDCNDTDCGPDPICQAPPTKGFDLILSADGAQREGNKNVVTVNCQASPAASLIAIGSIEKTHDPEEKGAQGWSIAVTHDATKLDISSSGFPTIEGTDAALKFTNGFNVTEIIDPARNNGKAGFVSAIVLALIVERSLDPATNQTIIRSMYTLREGAVLPTTILYMNGLRGMGQPVDNIITVDGDTVNPTNLIPLEVKCGEGAPPEGRFIRGNANDDGKVNIADPIWIINELVRQGPRTKCQDAADANDDGLVDLSDAMYLIQWRFLGSGNPPTAPFPDCGADPAPDTLNCPEGASSRCP